MKQKDISLIIVVSIISAVFSIVLSNIVFNSSADKKLRAEIVTPISAEFSQPSKQYFNSESNDPTQIIRIGDNTNQQPFNQ